MCFKWCPKDCCLAHRRRKLFKIRGRGGAKPAMTTSILVKGISKMYIHACMHTHMDVHMKTHVHAPKCSYTHACMHACTHIHSYMKIIKIKASALYEIEFRESDVLPGKTEVKQGKFVEYLSPAKGYFRETNKSQNINPISPTPKFYFGIIQTKVKNL